MSREIKFRCWDGENEQMIGNVGLCPDGGIPYTCPSMDSNAVEMDYFEGAKVMQFTGLKDKNGVDIYEGNILRQKNAYSDRVSSVRWWEKSSRWSLDSKYLDETEVIGNIYENPDLLAK